MAKLLYQHRFESGMVAKFNVYITDQIQPGYEPEFVQKKLAQRTGLPLAKIEHLFQNPRTCVKKALPQAKAEHYRQALESCGAVIELQALTEASTTGDTLEPVTQTETDTSEPETVTASINGVDVDVNGPQQGRRRTPFVPLAGVGLLLLLAAIVIWGYPAFEHVQKQQQMQQSLKQVIQVQQQLEDFVQRLDYLPQNNDEAGVAMHASAAPVRAIKILPEATIEVLFDPQWLTGPAHSLFYRPQFDAGQVTWRCYAPGFETALLPPTCVDKPLPAVEQDISSARHFKTVAINEALSLSIPASWKTGLPLHDDALFSAGDPAAETYALLLMDDKRGLQKGVSIHEYADQLKYQLQQQLQQVMDITDTVTGNETSQMYQLDFEASLDNVALHYQLAVFETADAFYPLLQWTLTSRISQHRQDFEKVRQSFASALDKNTD